MALMAAETLGIDYHQIRSIVADTSSVGYTHVTGGSRVTFATGMSRRASAGPSTRNTSTIAMAGIDNHAIAIVALYSRGIERF